MAAASVSPTTPAVTRPREPVAGFTPPMAAYLGLATLSAVQAWEWLFSGLAKLQNGAFIRGFVSFVSHAPGPYGHLMASLVTALPPGLMPRLVEAGELALGGILLVSAVVVLLPSRRLRLWAIKGSAAASLFGAGMATNIALIAGNSPPWHLSTAPFGTGVPVEALLAAISLAGVAEAYSAWRITRR